MPQPPSDSRLANLGAHAIYDAFDAYHSEFKAITRRAPLHFASHDWHGMQADAAARLDLYGEVIQNLVGEIRELFGPRGKEKLVWASMKAVYSSLIECREDWELAETFFNSVTRRIFTTVGVDHQIEFVDSDFDSPPKKRSEPFLDTLEGESLPELIDAILDAHPLQVDYDDREGDVELAAHAIREELQRVGLPGLVTRAEVVRSIFFRGKGAYIIGRLQAGTRMLPVVLALRRSDRGVRIDAVLTAEDDVSVLFSFTRSYFHVEVARPYELVRFLRAIMPLKPTGELYIALGYNKHGKTEMYRQLLGHVRHAQDQFSIAPGAPGMVMLVFTLHSYDSVFKIIRDQFDEPKSITRDEVRAKYHLVFKHDRAGRLVDAQEFEHLEFARSLFSEELLGELRRLTADSVRIEDHRVIIKHLYVERRLRPLDIFVHEAREPAVRAAVIDYGYAIKDLAKANIFPGDILLKNFGVTRHGRVVSYDYDELCLLTDCNFVALPEPHDEIETWSAEPWFYVHENDCFPAEFKTWLGLPEPYRRLFLEHHSDLYEVDFWRGLQARIRAGEILDILPYPERRRLAPRGDASKGTTESFAVSTAEAEPAR